jgi:ribosomal protein L7/L12
MGFFRRKERGLFEQPAAPAPAPAPVTQGPVQVVLLDAGPKKIHVIKLIREATGLGLKESKDLSEAAPATIGGFTAAAAAELVAALEQAGARASANTSGGGGTDAAAVRQLVWERDGGRCVRCGAAAELQYDHIIPLARGGSDRAENLQLLCAPCDRAKGDSIG